MSKGIRKSVPAALALVRRKLRAGTLGEADRATLHLISRLDLIDLIEAELSVTLSGGQKNSVAAMVVWLLGHDRTTGGVGRQGHRYK